MSLEGARDFEAQLPDSRSRTATRGTRILFREASVLAPFLLLPPAALCQHPRDTQHAARPVPLLFDRQRFWESQTRAKYGVQAGGADRPEPQGRQLPVAERGAEPALSVHLRGEGRVCLVDLPTAASRARQPSGPGAAALLWRGREGRPRGRPPPCGTRSKGSERDEAAALNPCPPLPRARVSVLSQRC